MTCVIWIELLIKLIRWFQTCDFLELNVIRQWPAIS